MPPVASRVLRGAALALRSALDLFWPPVCPGCGAGLEPGQAGVLCERCEAESPIFNGPACRRCGSPLGPFESDQGGRCCAECGGWNLVFTRAAAAGVYDGPLANIIKAYKYGARARGAHLARFLAGLLISRLTSPECGLGIKEIDMICPVPLHGSRRRQRGFDHAAELARHVSRRLGIPLELGNLVKTRATPSQAKLTRAERLDNIKGAFAVRRPERIKGKLVLLLDDVITTAATTEECARTLKAAGAREVRVAAVLRSVRGRDADAAVGWPQRQELSGLTTGSTG